MANELEPGQQSAVVERDRVRHAHRAPGGLERRPQHVRVLDVLALDAVIDLRRELERAPALRVEEPREDGFRVDVRQREPVDRAVASDERGGASVPEQGVVANRRISVGPLHGANYRCPK